MAAALFFMPAHGLAGKPADINKDGVVDKKEKLIAKTEGKAIVDQAWEVEADLNKDGIVDRYELKQWKELHKKTVVDTSEWETLPENTVLSDSGPDAVVISEPAGVLIRRDKDDNPPGPAGGPGTNWENPPGPAGGPGASPDRRGGRR